MGLMSVIAKKMTNQSNNNVQSNTCYLTFGNVPENLSFAIF